MYKIAVPVNTLHAVRSSKEALIANLRSLDAERVFLTLGAKGAACFPQKLAILAGVYSVFERKRI